MFVPSTGLVAPIPERTAAHHDLWWLRTWQDGTEVWSPRVCRKVMACCMRLRYRYSTHTHIHAHVHARKD